MHTPDVLFFCVCVLICVCLYVQKARRGGGGLAVVVGACGGSKAAYRWT